MLVTRQLRPVDSRRAHAACSITLRSKFYRLPNGSNRRDLTRHRRGCVLRVVEGEAVRSKKWSRLREFQLVACCHSVAAILARIADESEPRLVQQSEAKRRECLPN